MGKTSACFSWLDKFYSGILAWCLYDIVYAFGSLTLIGFYYGSLVWTIFVRESIYCHVNPESDIGSFACGCGGDQVILLGSVQIKLR